MTDTPMGGASVSEVLAHLEAAERPSIVLDAEICWTLERDRATAAFWRGAMGLPKPLPGEFSRLPRGLGMASLEAGSPNYTTSLDAALALAERALPCCRCIVERDHDGSGWACVRSYEGAPAIMSDAPTPALALCIAILRARQASNPTAEGV